MIEAFFLGSGKDQIFASYHPPVGGLGDAITVICPPLFTEYMRTHMALRELAGSLAESGQHVLRFDYRGTGDSAGELEDASLAGWLEDIRLATQEGKSISGANEINVLGVRASALLACKAVGQSSDVQKLVLWDPVQSGASYVDALRRLQASSLKRNIHLSRRERSDNAGDLAGYRVSDEMARAIHSLGRDVYAGVPEGKAHIVWTSQSSPVSIPGAMQETVQFACEWEKEGEDLMMPQPVLERVLACLMRK